MALRLLTALEVPPRAVNELLREAGHEPHFRPSAGPRSNSRRGAASAHAVPFATLPPEVDRALRRMADRHEPYPWTLLDPGYQLIDRNRGADHLFSALGVPAEVGALNLFDLVFDPAWARTRMSGWPEVARGMLARLQREVLRDPRDTRPRATLERTLARPGIPESWPHPDFATTPGSTLRLWFEVSGQHLGFLTTMTTFSAPGDLAVAELRIESWFPLDEVTENWCLQAADQP
jgi:hypothetical protein